MGPPKKKRAVIGVYLINCRGTNQPQIHFFLDFFLGAFLGKGSFSERGVQKHQIFRFFFFPLSPLPPLASSSTSHKLPARNRVLCSHTPQFQTRGISTKGRRTAGVRTQAAAHGPRCRQRAMYMDSQRRMAVSQGSRLPRPRPPKTNRGPPWVGT
jgi:hypothetical protein